MAVINKQAEGIKISEENRKFISDFFIMALLGIVFEWFESGIEYDLASSIDKLYVLLDPDIKEMLRRFEE